MLESVEVFDDVGEGVCRLATVSNHLTDLLELVSDAAVALTFGDSSLADIDSGELPRLSFVVFVGSEVVLGSVSCMHVTDSREDALCRGSIAIGGEHLGDEGVRSSPSSGEPTNSTADSDAADDVSPSSTSGLPYDLRLHTISLHPSTDERTYAPHTPITFIRNVQFAR